MCSALIFQFSDPVLFKLGYNWTYWLVKLLNIDIYLVHHKIGGIILISILYLSGICLIGYPKKNIFAYIFASTYLLHTILFNIFLCHSPHVQIGFVIILWAFCASTDLRFSQWWQAMRYFVCYTFFTAFLWKFNYGSFFQINGGVLFFKEYYSDYLLEYPNAQFSRFTFFLFDHPILLNLAEHFMLLFQPMFIIGFFTKKYDRYFALGLFIFIFNLCAFANHFFIEFFVIIFPLFSHSFWAKFNKYISIMNQDCIMLHKNE
jgi:hypothetical protein